MIKTKELREFYKTLSKLNNSFTHYSFVWKQFNIDYTETLHQNPETLTKDHFSDNPYRSKHNIKFKELEIEHSKTNESLVQGLFLLIYTHFEGYLKDVMDFSVRVNNDISPLDSKLEDVENDYLLLDKVFNRIGIDKTQLPSEILLSLDYIRLKRNRLIHSNAENISKSLNEIIKSKGIVLNEFWNSNMPSKLQGIDFNSKENANELTFSLIIDIINIFRRVSHEVDTLITIQLTENKILERIILPEFKIKQGKKIDGLKVEKVISKFKKYSESNYALKVNDEQIEILKCSIVQR